MKDIVLTLQLHLAFVLLGVLLLRLTGRQVRPVPLLLGFGVIVVYWVASIWGLSLQATLAPQFHWNWLGKILAIGATFIILAVLPGITGHDIGLTWQQKPGSVRPAMIMIAAICAFDWVQTIIDAEAADLSMGRLLFQGLMPGLDEELVFRGVVLALFTQAFGEGSLVLGARFGIAEVTITLLFGAAHGLHVSHGIPVLDAETFIVTGLIGAGLMWIRQRTGSLIMPVLAHNLVNFGESFF